MPLARSAVCVINKDNSSVMLGNSRVTEDKQEFEISDAPSNNSEISKKDSKEDDFTVCSANIIGVSESCVQQLDHKSSNVVDFCKAQEEGSIDNASVKREGCGNQLLILDEAEGTPIRETSLSCIQNYHNSLETTMPNKVFVAGEYIQESVSSIDNCEVREYSSEKSCRTELITVTRDTAQSKEDLEVIESINGEKFNKDMRMAANMLINAYKKEETGESKERFRQRLWCFLFENLNRAIDELYLLCELECDVEQMKEAGVVLEEALSDFKELKSRVEGFDKVEFRQGFIVLAFSIESRNPSRLAKLHLLNEHGSGKGKKASLHFTHAFKPRSWYFIGLEHIQKQSMLGKSESELKLCLDGRLYEPPI